MKAVQCKFCGAEIVWLVTKNQRRMAVDAASVHPEDWGYMQHRGHVSHWSTCKNVSGAHEASMAKANATAIDAWEALQG